MLIQFNFKNHKSFCNKSYLDLTATTERKHAQHLININGINLLPYVSIYGANASGKSTVIDAFYNMAKLIVRSFDSNINDHFEVVPFIFESKRKIEPSEFEIFLYLNDYEYRYGFIATKDEIVEEWLSRKPFKKGTRAAEKPIFEREKNDIHFFGEFDLYDKFKSLINSKALMLSFLGRKDLDFFGDLYRWFLDVNYISSFAIFEERAIKFLYDSPELKENFETLLNEIDPCLKKLEIKTKEDANQRIKYDVFGVHSSVTNPKENILLPLSGESDGTIKAIHIIPIIMQALDCGSVIFIDELDIHLHPLLLKKIVNLFTNKELNKKNAQLIFTSHSTLLMKSKDTRRDQIVFVEKDNHGKSRLYSLSDFKKVRVDADYETNYLAGSFGSVPFKK